MIHKAVTCFFAFLFLASSVLLPMGDFSLAQDIPTMYRNYSRITTQEELGVIDFVGDYLLHGKEIFGHNAHDKTTGNNNGVRFLHQANPINMVFLMDHYTVFNLFNINISYPNPGKSFSVTDFHEELFRPPLA